jgi:hypothetical protein
LTTFKADICSSKNHEVFFQKSIQLALKIKKLPDVNRLIKSALITYVSGADVNNAQDGSNNFAAKISMLKSLFRTKQKEESLEVLTNMG